MNRTAAVLFSVLTSGCIGSLTGGETDPPEPPPPEPPAAPVTAVTMKVRDGSMPQANVKVIFQDPQDRVILEGTTDATGDVTAQMPNGGSVTVVRTYGPSSKGEPGPIDHLYTYDAVKPGDRLELVGEVRDDTPVLAKINVGLEPGANVHVITPCGSGSGTAPTIEVQLTGCGPDTDFLVVDLTGDPEQEEDPGGPLYFTAHANVSSTIDLSNEVFRGTLTTEMSAANATMAVVLQKRLVMGDFTVYDSGQVPAYTGTLTTDVPELPNSQQLVSGWVYENDRTYVVTSRDYFSAAPITLDMSQYSVPSSTAPVFAGNVLSWSETGNGKVDLSVASLQVGAVGRQFVRSIAAPYTGKSLRVPVLPLAYDRYNIQPTDTPTITHSLASVSDGYDGVRPRAFNHALADLAGPGGIAAASYPVTSAP